MKLLLGNGQAGEEKCCWLELFGDCLNVCACLSLPPWLLSLSEALPGRCTPSLLLLQLFDCGCLPNGSSAVTRSVCPPPAPTPYSPSVQLSKSRLFAALARFDYCKLSSAETWSCPLLFHQLFFFFMLPLWHFFSPCESNGIFGVLSSLWGYLCFYANLAQRLDHSFFISEMDLVHLAKL